MSYLNSTIINLDYSQKIKAFNKVVVSKDGGNPTLEKEYLDETLVWQLERGWDSEQDRNTTFDKDGTYCLEYTD
jgi:hypothetical protein